MEHEDWPPRRALVWPLAVVLLGVALIGLAAVIESLDLRAQPWVDALFVPDGPLPEQRDRLLPASVRRLSVDLSPRAQSIVDQLRAAPEGKALIESLQPEKGERVVSLSTPPEMLQPLLDSGRLPVPGALEALAGDLASPSPFALDGAKFQIVGRLKRGVSGLAYAYVVLDSDAVRPHFSKNSGATQGWVDPNGADRLENDKAYFGGDNAPHAVSGATRSTEWVHALTLLGLLLVAAGGSWAQVRFLTQASESARTMLRHVLIELRERPKLFASMHILLYGTFFIMMFIAFEHPVAALRAGALVRDSFTKGDLSYIGSAYESGNILRAAGATLKQNYLVATLLLTLLPSLVIPFFGVFKNLLSFAAVGFVMAPLWTGTASQFVYHSITMTLEMEAYIVASFAVVALPVRVFQGTASGSLRGAAVQGLRVIASAALLTLLMLTIAALYEAATLIILGRFS